MKNRIAATLLSALRLIVAFAFTAATAAAQTAESVAGTYSVVSISAFGEGARGQMILGRDGRYSLILARAALPKIAAGSRVAGTTDENKAIVGGSIAHFGKYTVDAAGKVITPNIETSTYPNWDGGTSKRSFTLSGDQLTWTDSTPSGGGDPVVVVWKRIR